MNLQNLAELLIQAKLLLMLILQLSLMIKLYQQILANNDVTFNTTCVVRQCTCQEYNAVTDVKSHG